MHVKIELGKREFRLLLDLVYTGNWVLNSQRGPDRIGEYDAVASKIFAFCREAGMPRLSVMDGGIGYPSEDYAAGGIHEAIMDYEDTVFFEILAEELARRDMDYQPVSRENYEELISRMDDYIAEFEANGTDNLVLSSDDA